MKKKIFSLVALFAMIMSLCGCIKYNARMEIGNDKSMDFTVVYGVSKSLMEMNTEGEGETTETQEFITQEDRQKLINAGFSVVDYSDDTYQGVQLSKKITNIDDVSSESDVEYSLSGLFEEASDAKIFKVEKSTTKNVYTANFKFDANEAESTNDNPETDTTIEGEEEEEMDLSELSGAMSSTMDLKYTVKLPSAAVSSNATSVSDDGTELSWVLKTEKMENISFVFEIDNGVVTPTNNTKSSGILSNINPKVLFIAGGIFLLISLVMIILFVKSNKKGKGKNNVDTTSAIPDASGVQAVETPVAQVTPVTPVSETPVTQVTPVAQAAETPVAQVAPVAQAAETPAAQVTPVAQTSETPVAQVAPVAQAAETPVAQVAPVAQTSETPVTQVTPVAQTVETPNLNQVVEIPAPAADTTTPTVVEDELLITPSTTNENNTNQN